MDEVKKKYLGTNLKMYKTIEETKVYLQRLKELTEDLPQELLELFVIPSYTTLEAARQVTEGSHVKLGAQNMCWEKEGQFTGEISPLMLKEVGVDIVEIGHSERRHTFRETDQEEGRKVRTALEYGFTPLLCVGETLEQRNFGISDETLSTQLKVALHGLDRKEASGVWVAYEPVWAIGINGKPASVEYVSARHQHMRHILTELFGEKTGNRIPILYGVSVNMENAAGLIRIPWVDGLFIGRSAWDAENFNKIIRSII